MSYITLKQAAESTGLSEVTIRRLCKKPESKPYLRLEKAKKGFMYTIQANYLFDVYPPIKKQYANDYSTVNQETIQVHKGLLDAKDKLIELLQSENAYLRSENTGMREENRELKLITASRLENQTPDKTINDQEQRKSLWRRIFG